MTVGTCEVVFHAGENDAVEIEKIALGEDGVRMGEFFHLLPCFREVDGFEVILERLAGNGDAFGKHQFGFAKREAVAFDRVGLMHHPHIPRRRKAGDRLRRERTQRGEALVFGGEGGHPVCVALSGLGMLTDAQSSPVGGMR